MPHDLPTLAWSLDAFAPLISPMAMDLHFNVHHRGYVEQLNIIEGAMAASRHGTDDQARMTAEQLGRQYAFALMGHRLHTLFWLSLTPNAPPLADGSAIGAALVESFGSFKRAGVILIHLAATLRGSGWVGMAFDRSSGLLRLVQVYDHECGLPQGLDLLFVIDVWEHAYYLDFQSSRDRWLGAVISRLDWEGIDGRYRAARGDV